MDIDSLKEQLAKLDEQIEALPAGSISAKKVNGHTYFYHRWYEGKTKKEQFIPEAELEKLKSQIAQRKELNEQRKELKKQLPKERRKTHSKIPIEFITTVRRGQELRELSIPVLNYRRRECYTCLQDYVFGPRSDKVFVLYGLRRTGKTTMIRQILADMGDEMLERTAFIQISQKNTLADPLGLFLPRMNSCMTAASCCIRRSFRTANLSTCWESGGSTSTSAMAAP